MKKQSLILLCGVLLASEVALAAEKGQSAPRYRFDRIAHLSCRQVWEEADKSVDKAFAMIETMTVYLLKQRRQQFPDNQETGMRFGKEIDNRCKADPDQLMLSAVDASLRDVIQ